MKKSKVSYPEMSRMFEVLHKNHLTGAQFALMFDVTQENAPTNPLLHEMKIYIDNLVVMGWLNDEGTQLSEKGKSLFKEIEKLFKSAGKTIAVDLAMVEQYNNMFPEGKIPTTGKYARTNVKELAEAFGKFFLKYPEYHDWNIVFGATQLYVQEYEAKNWEYMKTNKYFIAKMNQDKTYQHELANYCQRFIEGEVTEQNHFTEKIV